MTESEHQEQHAAATPTEARRGIRSFVLRQGHMTAAQQRAIDEMWPAVGLDFRAETADLNAVFGRPAPKVLEIGFGMGAATAEIAARLSESDFLAIDVHGPGVGNLCKLIQERQLSNIRVMRHDAVEVVERMLADGSLDGIHIFFPDPWHKKRHHKRRLVQAPFVHLLAQRLAPGGYIHCATDWQPYAEQMLHVLDAEPLLRNTATTPDGYAPRPAYRPQTNFERRGLRLGHGVWDLVFERA